MSYAYPSAVPYVLYQVNLTATLCQITVLVESLGIYTLERGELSFFDNLYH